MTGADEGKWFVPLFVMVGLVISQLFIYGRKVKGRVNITFAEVAGDLMQFGVRAAITIGTIELVHTAFGIEMRHSWQVVVTTVLICTSFDTYFFKLREVLVKRLLGAAGVLFGRMPDNAFLEVPPGKGIPDRVSVHMPEYMRPIAADKSLEAGLSLNELYPPMSIEDDGDEIRKTLDKLNDID